MAKKFYIETYGCQMNFADSEVVASILNDSGFEVTEEINNADLILVNTCSIRDNAEQRVWGRLDLFSSIKRKRPSVLIGVLGCMAERLKEQLLESNKKVDLVVGPDAYRDLPALVNAAGEGHKAVNVLLSREETYADISPVRMDSNGVSAFISIMRGCNNMCSYCVVPYTRGAERSRDPHSIVREACDIFEHGYREVTLLGQNVDSYSWCESQNADKKISFAGLLEMVAAISPLLRVRFSTNHPKDLSDDLLLTMAKHGNICRHIHLPVQSGSNIMLERMNRRYTREWYIDRLNAIKAILPDCTISTDIITGFCGETPEDHNDTLSLMREAGFDFAYMFKYSERPNTRASRHFEDDIPEEIKTERLNEIIELQNKLSASGKKRDIGNSFEVLVEGTAKRPITGPTMTGRTSGNKVVVFEATEVKPGDYVTVTVEKATSATLIGKLEDKR